MVISVLNTTRIIDLLRFIEGCLEELRPLSQMKEQDFLADKRNPPFAESYLRRALEAFFDIGRHILSKTSGFKEIEYKAIARELGRREVMSATLSESLVKMAG